MTVVVQAVIRNSLFWMQDNHVDYGKIGIGVKQSTILVRGDYSKGEGDYSKREQSACFYCRVCSGDEFFKLCELVWIFISKNIILI